MRQIPGWMDLPREECSSALRAKHLFSKLP
jgi:hypothetical protein